jgi:hypothetical protein
MFGLLLKPELLPLPAELRTPVINAIKDIWTSSFTNVFYAGLIFIGIGIIVALSVGKSRIAKVNLENKQKEQVMNTSVATE